MSVAHPYESWFKSSHPGIPTGDVGTTGASAWWDVGAGWIDVQNPNGAALQTSLHSGGLQTSLHSPLGGYNSDYSSLSHSAFSTSASPHLLTTGQHLMDGFKPVLSSYPDSSPSPLGGAGGSMLTGGPTASLAGSPRSSARRYSGRATYTTIGINQRELKLVSRYLCIHQSTVDSLFGHELGMCSLLSHFAILNNHDDVSIVNSGQAMGNNNTCAAKPSIIQGLLHNLYNRKERNGQNFEETFTTGST
ncbi:hypothetical protein cypCar_00036250 [Cyprinus carpio]|nr:hypothetical protein cypCar_00036250 [Cyprinus carpio]